MHQNNVRYTYGDSTATYNQRGRIALMEDASGFQTFKYGRMGEVIENNHTFVLPNESHQYSFRMQYSYDSWNRVQYISYPDGEEVLYRYNTGGMLDSVYGRKSAIMRDGTGDGVDVGRIGPTNPPPTYTYHYITHTTYNEFELKSGQWYGNGTQAHYSYDTLQRLSHLTAYKSARTPMQDITYTYDKVGNITQISNAAGVVNTLGNIYSYSYTYDSLYRLTSSYGSVGSGKPLANYTLNMQYEADGRIIQKNQSGRTRLNGTVQTFNDSRLYTYNTSQPHTVQSISGTNYYWDANGNMTNDGGAILTWDEENRLKRHSKSLKKTCFFYDAAGERYYKNSGATVFVMINGIGQQMTFYENPTLYASPYVVVTPDGYTKHYFVESERFASRLGDGTISGLNNHVANAAALAAKQAKVNAAAPDSIVPNRFAILRQLQAHWSSHHTTYWQHSDHLGSASWVTDTNGMGYQHLQYMPWGEPLLDQRKSGYTYNTRYTFSGKERDEETGYSYFGARHYHPALSIWLSVDPLADKYPGVSPYTYCANNPVRLVDPDGREIWIDGYLYTPGQACPEGIAENTQKKWNTLNAIYEKRNGAVVITEMSSSDFQFCISSEFNTSGGGSYQKDGNKSGTIYLNGNDDNMGILAHELFHGYQHMNGQFGATIFNEIEANMFSYSITGDDMSWRYTGLNDLKNGTKPQEEGIAFTRRLLQLLTSQEFDQNAFNDVLDGFKQWSDINYRGTYNRYSMEIPDRSLIQDFYPLR